MIVILTAYYFISGGLQQKEGNQAGGTGKIKGEKQENGQIGGNWFLGIGEIWQGFYQTKNSNVFQIARNQKHNLAKIVYLLAS